MEIVRVVVAIVVGYVVFAAASMFLVGQIPATGSPVVVVLGLVALALIGVIAGFVARAISGNGRRITGYILAGLVAVATLANLLMQLGAEPTWYKVGTLVLTAPAILWFTAVRGGKAPSASA